MRDDNDSEKWDLLNHAGARAPCGPRGPTEGDLSSSTGTHDSSSEVEGAADAVTGAAIFDAWSVGIADSSTTANGRNRTPGAQRPGIDGGAARALKGTRRKLKRNVFDVWKQGVAGSRDPTESVPSDPSSIAQRGVAGEGARLPHYDVVQRAFGDYDLSAVRAHVGGAAADASRALGGHAYTFGNSIAFAEQPTVELVAHEATHVVQQRGGVSLKGIDGGASDSHEQQADAVASAVAGGMSAVPLLSRIASSTSGSAATRAVQRKSGSSTSSSSSPEPFKGPFDVAQDGMSARVRSTWVGDDAERWLDVLRAMQVKGAVQWADEAALQRLARILVQRNRHEAPVVSFRFDAAAIAIIGLPRDAKPLVELTPAGIQVAIAGLSGPQLDFELDLDDRQPELFYGVYTALETFTGLHATKLFKLHPRAASKTTALLRLTNDELAAIFGQDAWSVYRAREQSAGSGPRRSQARPPAQESAHDATGPSASTRGSGGNSGSAATPRADTANTLAPDESARVAAWFAHNHASPPRVVDLSVLALVDQIEATPELASAVRQLLQHGGGDERPLDATALRDLVDRARVDVERTRLGIGAFSVDRTTAIALGGKPQQVDAFDTAQLPARIVEQGLVLSGRPTKFDVSLDWSAYRGANIPGFAERNSRTVVDWVFERVDVAGPTAKNGAPVVAPEHVQGGTTLQHTFQLAPHEQSGTWTVHAFVYTSHFAPRHVTASIEVKTEKARMSDLRHEAFAGMEPTNASTSAHRFGLGGMNAAVAPVHLDGHDPDAEGTVTRGDLPAEFEGRTTGQRASNRQAELKRTEDLVAYLSGLADPRYVDALAAAKRRLAQLREVDKEIKNDETSGWQSFELRGTYLSRQPEVPSGPLDLYASVKRVGFAGIGPTVVEIQIRDHSQRYTQDTPIHTGAGLTFEAALEAAVVELAKDYPEGKVSVLGESMDASSKTARHTKKAIGFELPTTSSYKRAKDKLFNPVVQTALNVAATALMVFQPELAPVVMSIMAAQNTVRNVDDLAHAYETHTLRGGQVSLTLAQIGLDFLPFARGAKILSSPARLVAFEAVNHAGLLVVMAMQTRDAIASIQENDIAALAEQYRQLLDDEKTKNVSDPALDPELAKRQAAITEGAARIRNRVQEQWTNAIAQNGIFMVGAHIMGDIQRTRVAATPTAGATSGETHEGGEALTAKSPAAPEHEVQAGAHQDSPAEEHAGSEHQARQSEAKSIDSAEPNHRAARPRVSGALDLKGDGSPENVARQIGQYIANQLSVDPASVAVKPLQGGRSGAGVFRVRIQDRDVGIFKIFGDEASVENEVRMMRLLHAKNMKVYDVVAEMGQVKISTGDGARGGLLMETARGTSIEGEIKSLPPITDPAHQAAVASLESKIKLVARGMAEMHTAFARGSSEATTQKRSEAQYIVAKFARLSGKMSRNDHNAITSKLETEVIPAFINSPVPATAYHGDANAGNFLVDSDMKLHVIDVGTMKYSLDAQGKGNDTGAADLGRFVESVQVAADGRLSPADIERVQHSFLAEYFASTKLSPADFDAGIKLFRVELEMAVINHSTSKEETNASVSRIGSLLGVPITGEAKQP